MSKAVVTWKEDVSGWAKFTRTHAFQAHLKREAEEFVVIARAEFDAHSQHDDSPPIDYRESFVITRIPWALEGADLLPTYAYKVSNIDPIANLVEFGAHAGGDIRNPVLKYRIFGRTIDIIGSRLF